MTNQQENVKSFEEISTAAKNLILNDKLDIVDANVKRKKLVLKHGIICAAIGMFLFSMISFLMGEFDTSMRAYELTATNTLHMPFGAVISFLGVILFILGAMCEEMAQKNGNSFYKE